MSDKLRDIIYYLVSKLGYIESRTKLVKLIYLADVKAKRELNRTISGVNYVYHFYGPYSPKIIEKALEMDGEEIKEIYNPLWDRYEYYKGKKGRRMSLKEEEIKILDSIIKEYDGLSTQKIKEVAYNTKEMRKAKPGEIVLT